MNTENKSNIVTLPGAIIVAGTLIAIAIIWTKHPETNSAANNTIPTPSISEAKIRDISNSDHILGNPNASIKIIEYSDPSCPFCKSFNTTMEQVMSEYGSSGNVAWIYRHFPLDKPDKNGFVLHKNAGHEAMALECAASLGGNDKFWDYEKKLYETTPSVTSDTPNGLDQSLLPVIAKQVGLNDKKFSDCLKSGQFKDKIDADYVDGVNAGITGTPYSVMITPSGTKIPVTGAQPYSVIKNAIDSLLSENGK